MDFPALHQDQEALILGLGDSGLAMALWLARLGARVTVWDSREKPPQLAALREQLPQARFVHGELPAHTLDGVQLLFKSPGLSPLDARLQGELDLFAQALAELQRRYRYAPGVLAITGTNGKTTTTSMTAQLVERAGRRVAMAGNIGPTLLGTLAQALDKEPQPAASPAADAAEPAELAQPSEAMEPVPEPVDAIEPQAAPVEPSEAVEPVQAGEPALVDAEAESEHEAQHEAAVAELLEERPLPILPPPPKPPVFEVLPEVWVLELSSFQLEGVQGFEPSAAAVLNITQDHLDWHGDMAAYARAKGRIFGSRALMVINRDDAEVEALVPAPLLVKQGRGRPAKTLEREVCRFGLNPPQRPGDFGLVVENGMAWLVRARELEAGVKLKKGEAAEPLSIQRLMPADALRVRGRHNAANALAALALASAIGCPLAPMLHGLREYRGEPHRVEYVSSLKGVDFFDDSKGTNVGATVAAIQGLGADRAPAKLLMILGGDGKGQDFAPLAAPVAQHVRAVALIGRDGPQIGAALAATGVPMQQHDSLEAATDWCLAQAQPGDSVLLSPACASLDMFRNYAHRAEVFVARVRALAEDEGLIG